MGTPEDVATEKHFTPPTLTEMLDKTIFHADSVIPSTGDSEKDHEQYVKLLKDTFKEWLRTVGLPHWMSEESTRQLLITLVDEP